MTMIGKKLAAILLAVAMVVTFMPVMGAGPVYADEPGEAGGEIAWTPLPGSDTISYYLDEEGTLTLEGTGAIPDYTTYGANKSPFLENSDIKNVIIGEGITRIGVYTFGGCESLASVSFPSSLKSIGDSAFYNEINNSSLSSADLPDGLETIGRYAFSGSGLKSIEIPDTVTELGEGVFSSCIFLKTVKLSSGLKIIPNSAFSYSYRLKSVEIPDGVTTIDGNAFSGCSDIKKFTIPTSVNTMVWPFYECFSLEEVVFEGDFPETQDGMLFGLNVTAYYPLGNATWTDEVLDSGYGGRVKWVGYCKTHVPAAAVKENVKAATTTQAGSYEEVVYCSVCGEKLSSKTVTIPKLPKKANPLTIKAKTATVKYSKLKTKNQMLAVTKVITFTRKGQGTMSYTKASGNKKITINKTTGKVTVKKGLKKGTYKVKVKVKAAGNANYNASAVKTVTIKIKVK